MVFTIHNAEYGLQRIGSAAYFSQRFTTVSPSYASEVSTLTHMHEEPITASASEGSHPHMPSRYLPCLDGQMSRQEDGSCALKGRPPLPDALTPPERGTMNEVLAKNLTAVCRLSQW